MTIQAILTALLLPPFLFVLLSMAGTVLAWRGRRSALLLAGVSSGMVLLLSTPMLSGALLASLQPPAADPTIVPTAIVILGAEAAHTPEGVDVGPLTLERLRAGVVLHRRTGLPILVTAGPNAEGDEPLAAVMARSLATDFGTPARWVELGARDTRDNAVLSAAMLRRDGIDAAYLVTHAWHLPRASRSFARAGFATLPAPVRDVRWPDGRASDWLPRPDHLAESWFALREWAGRLVYAIRD